MAKKIFEALKKHGFIPKDLAADKVAELERDFDAIEDDMVAGSKSAAIAKKEATEQGATTHVDLPPELLGDIETLKSSVASLVDGLKVVVDATKTGQAERSAQEKQTQEKRYTDHVKKLADEGRITKAQHDEFMKPEKVESNLKALDMFVEHTDMLPVQPALARGQVNTSDTNPAAKTGAQTLSHPAGAQHAERKALEDAALQELVDNMNG